MNLSKLLEQVQKTHPDASMPNISNKNIEKIRENDDNFDIYRKETLDFAPVVLLTHSTYETLPAEDIFFIEEQMMLYLAQSGYIVVSTKDDPKATFAHLQETSKKRRLNLTKDDPKICLAAVVDIKGLEFFKDMVVLDIPKAPPFVEGPFWFFEPWFSLVMDRCEKFVAKHLE